MSRSATQPTAEQIATKVATKSRQSRVLVAVDGGDASGKTTYASELADALRGVGRTALVIHVDDFMHVRAVRHRRGRTSPDGYLDDSYDYEALTRFVLEPLSASGNGWYRAACVDRARDIAINSQSRYAHPGTITVVEGLFLHRDELARWWDFSIFLDVDIEVAMARKERRDQVTLDPDSPLTKRYVEGQRAYRERYQPHDRATWTIAGAD